MKQHALMKYKSSLWADHRVKGSRESEEVTEDESRARSWRDLWDLLRYRDLKANEHYGVLRWKVT